MMRLNCHKSTLGSQLNLKMKPTSLCSNKIDLKVQPLKLVRNTSYASFKIRTSLLLNQSCSFAILFLIIAGSFNQNQREMIGNVQIRRDSFLLLAAGHIVLTKDDHGQSLVLTGEDGKGGKKGGGGDQLVIAGNNMGSDGQNSNMVMQDASNREGDVVINGNSMIIPGEDGHIVLSDSRRRGGDGTHSGRFPINPLIYWLPYMNNRFSFRMMPYFGGQFG